MQAEMAHKINPDGYKAKGFGLWKGHQAVLLGASVELGDAGAGSVPPMAVPWLALVCTGSTKRAGGTRGSRLDYCGKLVALLHVDLAPFAFNEVRLFPAHFIIKFDFPRRRWRHLLPQKDHAPAEGPRCEREECTSQAGKRRATPGSAAAVALG